ncbi:MAG: protein kinase [Polyangiaceae bacterium]
MSSDPTPADDPLRLAGTRVGPYAVLKFASVGGFAAVYRAEHESLHFPVALKVLMPEVVPEHARGTLEQYFLREAQILAQLRSEHILRAHHHGKVSCPVDGVERSYIVVDWLDGQELSRVIEGRLERNEPYSVQEVLKLLEPIALALDAVHAQGLAHRDVNSRNIFLADNPGGGMPRAILIDFGFAKQAEQSVSGLVIQESTDTLMAGSPDFAAPEHFDRLRFGEPTPKTDLYTFALTLVHALTLRPPLAGDSPRELFEATLDPEKRPTPNRRGAQLAPEVDALFARALAVEPKDRPPGLLDWWNDLKTAVLGASARTSLRAPPPKAPEPAARAVEPSPSVQEPKATTRQLTTAEPSADAEVDALVAEPPKPKPPDDDLDSEAAAPVRRRRVLPILVVTVFTLGALGVVTAAAMGVSWRSEPKCEPGFANCNQLPEDGCEANLNDDALHCGACGTVCSSAAIDGVCQAGQCVVRKCLDRGRRDCNADFSDGCETDVNADPQHCGKCEARCSDEGARSVSCDAGSCVLKCSPNRSDCDEKATNGCEAQLQSDPANCGACGVSCQNRSCDGGLCEPERFAEVATEGLVAASGEDVAIWDKKAGQIQLRTASAEPEVLWRTRASLTALVLSKELVVWAQDKPAMVYGLARDPKARPKRLAGPLPSPSDLVLTADRRFVSFVADRGRIVTAPLDKTILEGGGREAQCAAKPQAYAGNAERQLCCAKGEPLASVVCADGGCDEKKYSVPCPSGLSVDAERVYFAQGTRIVRVELESGKIERWLSRRKPVSDVALQNGWLYWNEAGQELWRAPLASEKPSAHAQRLARATAPASFFVGEGAAFWFQAEKTDAGSAVFLRKNPLSSPPLTKD